MLPSDYNYAYRVLIRRTQAQCFKKNYKTQEPKFKRLKNRKNLRTTGFNLCIYYQGKRSVLSTLCMKERTQASKLFIGNCRYHFGKLSKENLKMLFFIGATLERKIKEKEFLFVGEPYDGKLSCTVRRAVYD